MRSLDSQKTPLSLQMSLKLVIGLCIAAANRSVLKICFQAAIPMWMVFFQAPIIAALRQNFSLLKMNAHIHFQICQIMAVLKISHGVFLFVLNFPVLSPS